MAQECADVEHRSCHILAHSRLLRAPSLSTLSKTFAISPCTKLTRDTTAVTYLPPVTKIQISTEYLPIQNSLYFGYSEKLEL
jgi:hypothetical protein